MTESPTDNLPTAMEAYDLGVRDSVAQGRTFAMGRTWGVTTLDEHYDCGVNLGLALVRVESVLAEATVAVSHIAGLAGQATPVSLQHLGWNTTDGFCDALAGAMRLYRGQA